MSGWLNVRKLRFKAGFVVGVFRGAMLQDEQGHRHVPKGAEGSAWMQEVGPVQESTFTAPHLGFWGSGFQVSGLGTMAIFSDLCIILAIISFRSGLSAQLWVSELNFTS